MLIQGDATVIPLADDSVDLVVTSPPYFALRSYQDDGEHYDGQIGSEATPQEFLEALWAATVEMVPRLLTSTEKVCPGSRANCGSTSIPWLRAPPCGKPVAIPAAGVAFTP